MILGFLTILFLMFMFIGLLTLAHELEFPFSKDGLFDHRVTNLVHGIAKSSAKILFESPCIGTTAKDIEHQANGRRLQSFEIQMKKSATKIKRRTKAHQRFSLVYAAITPRLQTCRRQR